MIHVEVKEPLRIDVNTHAQVTVSDGGYERGYAAGYETGSDAGEDAGLEKGFSDGHAAGYSTAVSQLTDISISENGEYTPDEGSTGFKRVLVDVQASAVGRNLNAYIDRTITEASGSVAEIGLYAFTYCTALEKIDFPNATSIKSYAFQYCSSLKNVSFPKVQGIGGYAFMSCTMLENVDIPNMVSVGNYAFRKCDTLKSIDLNKANSIGTFAFYESPNLETVILRSTGRICTLSAANAFQYTKIADGAGFIYVPDSLVDQYKATANWSAYAAQIKPLSQLPEEVTN